MESEVHQVPEGGNQEATTVVTQQPPSLGWRAALPDEFKEHEFVKDCQKPGDFVKRAIDTKTERDSLKAKLENYIPKLPDNATPEEREVFYLALGKPEKPDGYVFQPDEGVEHDEAMVDFAKNAFFEANLNKEQASVMTKKWDAFVASMKKAKEEAAKAEVEKANQELQKELGAKYNEVVELTKRLWTKHMGDDEKDFLETTKTEDGILLGNHPAMIRLFTKIAKLTAEDSTVQGSPPRADKASIGMRYDKSPAPPPKT